MKLLRYTISKTRCSVLLLGLLLLAGCGDSLPHRVPVSGVVTFDGGPPPAEGTIDFAAIEVFGGAPNRPAMARFDTTGKFAASSFGSGDGLIPGRYRVRIQCWKSPPEPVPGGEEAATYIAAGFEAKELLVDMNTGSITDLRYDVPLKKATNK